MVQNTENMIFMILIVDLEVWMWYDNHVGAAGRPARFSLLRQKKWPLTNLLITQIVKGHFCSFLLSNIYWLTSLSAGSTPAFSLTKFVILLQEEWVVKAFVLKITCTLVSPLCAFIITRERHFFKMGYSIRKCYVNRIKGRNCHFEAENHWLEDLAVIW